MADVLYVSALQLLLIPACKLSLILHTCVQLTCSGLQLLVSGLFYTQINSDISMCSGPLFPLKSSLESIQFPKQRSGAESGTGCELALEAAWWKSQEE